MDQVVGGAEAAAQIAGSSSRTPTGSATPGSRRRAVLASSACRTRGGHRRWRATGTHRARPRRRRRDRRGARRVVPGGTARITASAAISSPVRAAHATDAVAVCRAATPRWCACGRRAPVAPRLRRCAPAERETSRSVLLSHRHPRRRCATTKSVVLRADLVERGVERRHHEDLPEAVDSGRTLAVPGTASVAKVSPGRDGSPHRRSGPRPPGALATMGRVRIPRERRQPGSTMPAGRAPLAGAQGALRVAAR